MLNKNEISLLINSISEEVLVDLAIANIYIASIRLLFPCPFFPMNIEVPLDKSRLVSMWFRNPLIISFEIKIFFSDKNN